MLNIKTINQLLKRTNKNNIKVIGGNSTANKSTMNLWVEVLAQGTITPDLRVLTISNEVNEVRASQLVSDFVRNVVLAK